MNLTDYSLLMLPEVENELHSVLDLYRKSGPSSPSVGDPLPELYDMLSYHLGWDHRNQNTTGKGKRIRPLITLLACTACGGDWKSSLPAAASIELIHNFSLIHDDIQDESPLRHGQATVWKRWGAAQAINAGDLMFTLALLAVMRPDRTIPGEVRIQGGQIILNACMDLTRGQTLDMAYETCKDLAETEYWQMVKGKTSALLSASARLGSLFAGSDEQTSEYMAEFGLKLGLAFQAQDDLLGIWGEQALTGKSSESDLASGKKSLPVVYALQKNGPFAQRWHTGPIKPEDIIVLADMLEAEGAREYTLSTCSRLTRDALDALARAVPLNEGRAAMEALASSLLNRQL